MVSIYNNTFGVKLQRLTFYHLSSVLEQHPIVLPVHVRPRASLPGRGTFSGYLLLARFIIGLSSTSDLIRVIILQLLRGI